MSCLPSAILTGTRGCDTTSPFLLCAAGENFVNVDVYAESRTIEKYFVFGGRAGLAFGGAAGLALCGGRAGLTFGGAAGLACGAAAFFFLFFGGLESGPVLARSFPAKTQQQDGRGATTRPTVEAPQSFSGERRRAFGGSAR